MLLQGTRSLKGPNIAAPMANGTRRAGWSVLCKDGVRVTKISMSMLAPR